MATIKIGKVETLFTNTPHTATSYQIYNGDNGQIIGQSIRNTTQLLQWSNELSDGNGGHYLHLHNLRARIQLHYGLDDSEWIELDPYDEDIQIVLDYVAGVPDAGTGESKIETRVIKQVKYLRS